MVEKTEEKGVTCPTNLKWLKGMLSVLPEGLRGKLSPFSVCLEKSSGEIESEAEKEKVEEKAEEEKPGTLEE